VAKIESVRELEAYKMAFDAAMRIFHRTKAFPAEERFSLTDQMRRAVGVGRLWPPWAGAESSAHRLRLWMICQVPLWAVNRPLWSFQQLNERRLRRWKEPLQAVLRLDQTSEAASLWRTDRELALDKSENPLTYE